MAGLAYLVLMVLSGKLPGHGHFVAFEAGGPLREPPAAVTRVQLRRTDLRATLQRRSGAWEDARGRPLAPEATAKLALALRLLHAAAAVRTLPAAADGKVAAAYGLAPPALAVQLADDRGVLLEFDLGGRNPDGMLRYLQVRGAAELMLVDDFVGAAWDELAHTALSHPESYPESSQ
jgi:hypothetical protein